MASNLFTKWLQRVSTSHQGVILYGERHGARSIGLSAVKALLGAHFVGETTIVQAGGYTKASAIIASSLWCKQLILGTASGVLGFVGSPRISRRTLRFDFCRANSELPRSEQRRGRSAC